MNLKISTWLEDHGVGQYAAVFADNDIDMDVLGDLTDQDLRELGVSLGHRKRILRAIAPGRSATVPASPNEAGAERRQLTVMFCDLVDSTALSVQVDPEDLRHIISSFQKCCERVVDIFGGSVARYMGDGVLVYFGYPNADEHDPERAVRAGLEITRAVSQLNVKGDIVLQTRVGIATGEVIVGDLIGEGASQEHAAIGETPNLAARLQGLAEPDTVVVSHVTRRLVGGLFAYGDLGHHTLKGFKGAVQAWKVGQEHSIESRFDATHSDRELAPLVGRTAETDRLLEAWIRARDGDGQCVLVTGEAGIGKSHLSAALRARISGERHALLRYFCVPYQQKTPLFPVSSQLERAANISSDDSPQEKLQKIEWMAEQFSDQLDEIVPLYCNLLGVPLADRYPALDLSPRLQKERVFDALINQLVAVSHDLPVLMVFEDLHWIDTSSLELLELFMQRLPDLPVLLVMTGRPEFMPPWPASPNTTALQLERLGNEHAVDLIDRITGGKRLPQEVLDQILHKTDGVPLFVEELTKSLLEANLLEERENDYVLKQALPDHAVPSTLQDSLMARLDRLGAGKKVAQIGAAIGRRFSFELLARVCSLKREPLERALERLAAAGLVYRDGNPPRADYLFKHALIQDAAYTTLLKDNRLALHSNIADTLELYYPETVASQPHVVAHHRTRSGDFLKAVPLWEQAARQALARAASAEALKHVEQAMGLLKRLPPDAQVLPLELGLQVVRGVVFESTLGYAASEVGEAYDRAREICEELDRPDDLVPVLLGLYVFNLVRGNFQQGLSLAQRCVELSKASKNLVHLIESYAALGFVEGHLGNLSTSRSVLEECIALYKSNYSKDEFPGITAQDPCVASYAFLAIDLWLLGLVDDSERVVDEGFALAGRLKRPINFGVAHAHAAEYYHMRRDYTRALDHGRKGIEVSVSHGYDAWYLCSLMHTGITMSTMTGDAEGVAMGSKGIELWRAGGARTNLVYFIGSLAWGMHVAGMHHEARKLLRDAFDEYEQTGEHLHSCLLHHLNGQMLLASPDRDTAAAETSFRLAIALADGQGATLYQLRATTSLHQLLAEQGRSDETIDSLTKLVQQFPAGCQVADLRDARAAFGAEASRAI